MNKKAVMGLIITALILLTACGSGEENQGGETSEVAEEKNSHEEKEKEKKAEKEEEPKESTDNNSKEESPEPPSLEEIQSRYQGANPKEWGEKVSGVKRKIETDEKVIALTLDACGGSYDRELMEYLQKEEIPATLFVSGGWINNHKETLVKLWEDPLFDIANHGKDHKPLSVTGKSAYGIPGTDSIEGVYREVYENHLTIKEITGQPPKFFRSGTAYYDEVAVKITEDLGETVVNYNVLGDGGATFSEEEIYERMIRAEPGAIMLFHMNHPESDVAKGIKRGVKALVQEGFEFVLLKDYKEDLK